MRRGSKIEVAQLCQGAAKNARPREVKPPFARPNITWPFAFIEYAGD